jgi:hypothetical protein
MTARAWAQGLWSQGANLSEVDLRVRSEWLQMNGLVSGQVHSRGEAEYLRPLSAELASCARAIEDGYRQICALLSELDG